MKKMYVGPDATTDYWIAFKDIDHLRGACDSMGDENLDLSYNSLKKNIGEEISIDNSKESYFDSFLEALKNQGATIETSLGGNAAIEVLAARAQELPAIYYGAIPKLNVSEQVLSELSQDFLGQKINFEPKSFISISISLIFKSSPISNTIL